MVDPLLIIHSFYTSSLFSGAAFSRKWWRIS
nr:MAG TPA: hypothetical protein [Caudoviricetes sp.]